MTQNKHREGWIELLTLQPPGSAILEDHDVSLLSSDYCAPVPRVEVIKQIYAPYQGTFMPKIMSQCLGYTPLMPGLEGGGGGGGGGFTLTGALCTMAKASFERVTQIA